MPEMNNLAAVPAEKLRKYTDLSAEILAQWRAVESLTVVPIQSSALGVVQRTQAGSLEELGVNKAISWQLQ